MRPPSRRLRLGTRASALATTQAEWVAGALRALGHQVELVPVRTEGDISRRPLTEIGGTGVFASALRQALLEDRIDVAVHSLKDIPVAAEPGLLIAAVPEREDPRDVLVARDGLTLDDLPAGSVLGTGSPRRAAQLAVTVPQLRVRDIRGNVETRIGMVRSGELDGVVLAAAGLTRLGRLAQATQLIALDRMLPAPGQGALAVECRADDDPVVACCAELDDQRTRISVQAERALLARLEAGCTAPVAALGVLDEAATAPAGDAPSNSDDAPVTDDLGGTLTLTGFAALEGRVARHRMSGTGTDAGQLGHQVAEELLAQLGTGQLLPDTADARIQHVQHTTERDT